VCVLGFFKKGNFKAGMRGFSAAGDRNNVGVAHMGNQVGRDAAGGADADRAAAAARLVEEAAAVGLEQEELILDPKANPMAKRTPQASFGSKGNTAGVENVLAGEKALRELQRENGGKEELILQPADDFKLKRVQGGSSMRSKSGAGATHTAEKVERDLRRSEEVVLQLEPTDADRQTRAAPLTASFSGAHLRETRHDAAEQQELRQSAVSLKLDPTDAASRFRVTGGGAGMSSKVTRVEKPAETQAILEYNRASTEELKINPNVSATRVSMPNASAMASRETRIRSSHDDRAEALLRKESEEVLVLDPEISGTGSRRRLKAVSSMGNTEQRFPAPQDTAVAEKLRWDVEPEVLIIDPKDAATRKNASSSAFAPAGTGPNTQKKPSTGNLVGKTGGTGKLSSTGTSSATTGSSSGSKKPATISTTAGGKAGDRSSSTKKGAVASAASAKKPGTAIGTAKAAPSKAPAPAAPALVSGRIAGEVAEAAAPSTPQVRAPLVSAKSPTVTKSQAMFNNMSPNEMIDLIDLQSKMGKLQT
jgi:hypothetical protein